VCSTNTCLALLVLNLTPPINTRALCHTQTQVQLENIRCDIYSQTPKTVALTLKNLYCAPSYSISVLARFALTCLSLPHAV
jgi:hypothetical protein